ncbi:hypothetical protein BCU68_05760 [Vibrio sp. 10N.286.49.B3]|uniref:GGDEF domain-containing protein n=1 Tax=Vibrio sp. 10N.286.49.B3 TaxID=1880855 RepID=UPI000C865F1B|nr:GGDEF domain-containing protein [Vibrio sp. 10N.286.49.B3]PMH41186.1 hypothetical protein BCU68_05760 [Vibrio sp. 10N.286.49.B3]
MNSLFSTSSFKQLRYQHFLEVEVYRPYSRFMFFAIFIFACFAIPDWVTLESDAIPIITARLIYSLIASCILYRATVVRWRYLQLSEILLFIASGWIIHWAGYTALMQNNNHYQDGILLLLIYIGTLSRLSFISSCIASFFVFIPYMLFLHPQLLLIDPADEMNKRFILIGTTFLCLIASYRRELETKYRFEQKQILRKQTIRLAATSKKLKVMSETDALTQAYNRHFLTTWLDIYITLPTQKYNTVAMLDIDHFKQINDRYGHDVGDKVITAIAAKIKQHIPKNSLFIRYGGEEFLLFLQFNDRSEAYQVIEKLRNDISQFEIASNLNTTISTGIYYTQNTTVLTLDAISFADKALYKAKDAGRNCTHFSLL